MRHGRQRIGDAMLCRVFNYLTMDELRLLLRGFVPSREATPEDAIRVVERARSDPDYREFLLKLINQALGDYVRELNREWVVKQDDIDAYIKFMRLAGRTEKTIRDRVRYITKALAALNWTLEPESLRDYLAELKDEEGEHVLRHVTASLKSFLKHVLKPPRPWALHDALQLIHNVQAKEQQ